jgi:fido (protein-threonine AMPylation protein)
MFRPQFDIYQPSKYFTSFGAAVLINAPHEPKAVEKTKEAIDLVAQKTQLIVIDEYLVRGVHQHICEWVKPSGMYRKVPVIIGNEIKDFWAIPQQMADLHPFRLFEGPEDTMTRLKLWYKLFQEIHPFEDGNDLVGGVIIAGISLAFYNVFLLPRGL